MLDTAQLRLPLLDDNAPVEPHAGKARRRAQRTPQSEPPRPEERVARLAFLGVAASWALTAREALQLLGEPLSTEAERLDRLHGILGAHRSLLLLAPDPAAYVRMLRAPVPAFDGASLLDTMLMDGRRGIARARAHLLGQLRR